MVLDEILGQYEYEPSFEEGFKSKTPLNAITCITLFKIDICQCSDLLVISERIEDP